MITMKTNLLQKVMLLCAGVVITLVSCQKDPDDDITAKNLKGMFVVCEGNFGSAEGDITWTILMMAKRLRVFITLQTARSSVI